MEIRKTKLIVSNAGGTAGKGSKTYKISLPSKWVNKSSLNKEAVEICFDGEKIAIHPVESLNEFITKKKQLNHKLKKISVFCDNNLCTEICADYSDETVKIENFTKDIIKTAFGNNMYPTWEDYNSFLEERCVPKSRSGIREYLEALGLCEYDPIRIIEKTKGKMAEDNIWLETEDLS